MQYTYIDITSKGIVILSDFTTDTIYISLFLHCLCHKVYEYS